MRQVDNRMSVRQWLTLASVALMSVTIFSLITRSWTPLRDGAPVIALLWILFLIRLGAQWYERRERRNKREA